MGTFQQTEANCLQPIIVMRVLSLLAIVGLCHGKSIIGGNGVTLLRSLNLTETRDKASSQTLTCYDYSGGGGDSVRAIDYIPALRNYIFDNRIGSCCFTGTWVLYSEENYNSYNTGASNWWAYGENYCLDVPAAFDNQASSLRFTGAPDDWKYDTINLYFNDYFIGDEEFAYNDMTQLNYDNRAKSIVVTGCSAWTCTSTTTTRAEPCVSSLQTPASASLASTQPPTPSAASPWTSPVLGGAVTPRRRFTLSTTWAAWPEVLGEEAELLDSSSRKERKIDLIIQM